ncbi:hypothetical protein B296_00013008 [Ensete ventricosum]|uniref:Uncharacterized protein n=1 Tax=Ensete ventricosum TaxID=4639 RepID=A0A426Z537_ENSVE|nr:hypothetical protein B296_00013008 [Ensete ventricosum]
MEGPTSTPFLSLLYENIPVGFAITGIVGWSVCRTRSVRPPTAHWQGCRKLVGPLRLLYHVVDPLLRYRSSTVKCATDQAGTPALPVGLTRATIVAELRSLECVGGELMIRLNAIEVCNSSTRGLKVAEVCNSSAAGLKVAEVCNSGTTGLKVAKVCNSGITRVKVIEVCNSGATGLKVAEACNSSTTRVKVTEVCNSSTTGLKVTEVCNSSTTRLKVAEVCNSGTIGLNVAVVYNSGTIRLKVAEVCEHNWTKGGRGMQFGHN